MPPWPHAFPPRSPQLLHPHPGLDYTSTTSLSVVSSFGWGAGFFGGNKDKKPTGQQQPTPLDGPCLAKAQEYARGGSTAPTFLAYLKKHAAQNKGQTLDQLVAAAAAAVPNEARRALLLKTHASLTSSSQASNMGKFTSTSSSSSSSRSTPAAPNAGMMLGDSNYRLLSAGSTGPRISSGKSAVLDAVAVDGGGKSRPMKAKLSKNLVALRREADNLQALRATGSGGKNSVIQVMDFLENYDRRGSHALVMEAGEEDLVGRVKRGGALKRGELKKVCVAVLEVLAALEKKKLVWTDLRAPNLVLVGGKIKAIDLESAVGVGEKPVDCTPEVTPPEVARLYAAGQLTSARVALSYDVWSLGILLLFLGSGGKQLLDGEAPSRVMASLATLTQDKVVAQVDKVLLPTDAKTAALVKKLLAVDPSKRPTVAALKREMLFF